jgi:hypothetical protein
MLQFTDGPDIEELLKRMLPAYNGRAGWQANRGVPKAPRRGYAYALVGLTPLSHPRNPNQKAQRVLSPVVALVENRRHKRYSGERLRELRAERGVGSTHRVREEERARWQA